jgi:hypothetical protein
LIWARFFSRASWRPSARRPSIDTVALNEVREALQRIADDLRAVATRALAYLGGVQRGSDLRVEELHDRFRHPGRSGHAETVDDHVAAADLVVHRRDIGKCRIALETGDGGTIHS